MAFQNFLQFENRSCLHLFTEFSSAEMVKPKKRSNPFSRGLILWTVVIILEWYIPALKSC